MAERAAVDPHLVEVMLENIYSAAVRGIGMDGDRLASLSEFHAIRSYAASALKEFGRDVHSQLHAPEEK